MTKSLAVLMLCAAVGAHAQGLAPAPLQFDQRIADCENKWFAAEAADGGLVLGYVYIDPSAGFTFEYYGNLDNSGDTLRAVKSELHAEARLITRIGNNFPAACFTESQAEALGLPSSPPSMKFYQDDRSAGDHHASWASHYNHIGASEIALKHVSSALDAGHESPGLNFEHAFALNVLERFDETIALVGPLLGAGSTTDDLIAELAYAHLRRGEYQRAIDLYTQAVAHNPADPSTRRWEFARNIAVAYDQLGDGKSRDEWIERSDGYKRDQ
jgi:tetratricopeptide (TPR) repeat protein